MNFMNEIFWAKKGLNQNSRFHSHTYNTNFVRSCACALMVKQQKWIKTCVISIMSWENFCNQIDRFCTPIHGFHVGTKKRIAKHVRATMTTTTTILTMRRGEVKEKRLKYRMHQFKATSFSNHNKIEFCELNVKFIKYKTYRTIFFY